MRIKRHLGADLTEYPDDPERLKAAIALRRREVKLARERFDAQPNDHTSRGILARELNTLGDLLTLGRSPKEAEAILRETLDHWVALDRNRAHVLSSLKLATALRHQRRLDEALELLNTQLDKTLAHPDELGVYTQFLLTERGIVKAQRGELEGALEDLHSARERFQLQGARKQVQQVEQILGYVEPNKKKGGGPPPH